MAPAPSNGQVVGERAQPAPELQSPHSAVVTVPPAPAEYRHLSDGFRTVDVSPWAERRICEVTGSSALYTTRALSAGAVLTEFSHKAVLAEPNYLTVQVGDSSHIMLSPEWLQYVNHSCEPNVFFDTSAFQLIALRDIAPNEELCFFYCSTEWSMAAPFDCQCGKPSCVGKIRGAAHMLRSRLMQYRLSDFITSKLGSSSDEGEA